MFTTAPPKVWTRFDRHTRFLLSGHMAERPWRTLRERPEIEFMLCPLPDGVRAIYATQGGHRAILVNRDLPPAERLAAIAHELVHDERGHAGHDPQAPEALRVAVAREECRVEQIVADQLVPPVELRAYVRRACTVGSVRAQDVAEEFDCPIDVADRALRRLLQDQDRREALAAGF